MKLKLYTRLLLVASVLFCTACENWLDLQPEGEATADELYSTGAGYRSVLNGLYRNMGKKSLYGGDLQFGLVDCMSQQYDLKQGTSVTSNQAHIKAGDFDYKDNAVVSATDAVWSSAFNIIATANDLIQHAESASSDVFEQGEEERRMILGEAYACRALLHFDLLRLFAPAPLQDDGQVYVPYVTTYPNITASRIAVKPFLEYVIADLEKARENTKDFDTSKTGVKANAFKNRFSKSIENDSEYGQFFAGRGYRLNYYAITALLARVCQYAGGDEMEKRAFDYANEVINAKDDSEEVFYKDNFEGITSSSGATIEAFESKKDLKAASSLIFAAYNPKSFEENSLVQYFAKPTTEGTRASYLPVRIEDLFTNRGTSEATADIRACQWLWSSGSVMLSGKWFLNDTETLRDEAVNVLPVLRLTEMRYIVAEYYARKGQYEEAYGILNTIRQERGLATELTQQNSWEEFVTDLVGDARREWIAEGQLFYLYKRLGAKVKLQDGRERVLTRGELIVPTPVNQVN